MSIPHCRTCACTVPVPEPVSDVRLLPVDLDRRVPYRLANGQTGTDHCMEFLSWDPTRYGWLHGRLSKYRYLLDQRQARNVREAVKMLAVRRREWMQAETARHAEMLRAKYTGRGSAYWRAFPRKRDLVLAGAVQCAYCGADNPRTVDHIIPTSRGGDHRRKNLAPACRRCNSQKNFRTPEEWRVYRLEAGLPWPPPPTSERPHIRSGLSFRPLTEAQTRVLRHLGEFPDGSDLPPNTYQSTIRSLERGQLMEHVPGRRVRVITDRGRVALESGRIPH